MFSKFLTFLKNSRRTFATPCQHEILCACPEYLNRLIEEQLLDLRVQYRIAGVDSLRRALIRHPKSHIRAVNEALKERFGLSSFDVFTKRVG